MLGLSTQADLLSQLLHAADMRHRAVSQNLANVNTPGYQRLRVEFEEQLARQLRQPRADAPAIAPAVVKDMSRPGRPDGNNVDVDVEIGELQRNALLYQTYAQVLASQFGMMRRAIGGE